MIALPNGKILEIPSVEVLAWLASNDAELFAQFGEEVAEMERQLDFHLSAQGLVIDLATFTRQAWEVVEPETPLQWSWHYDYLAEWLTMVATGQFKEKYPDKKGLIVNVPPRTGKSTFLTVSFPCWVWARFPSRRFLFSSHSLKLSGEHNEKRRFLIHSQWYQDRFGDKFRLITEGSGLLKNDRTGQFHVTSIGTKQTGFGGLILIGDDLLDRANAYSETVKDSTNAWLDSSFSKMLDDQVRGVFVHISQRLAIDDPTGHLLGEDEGSQPSPRADQWVVIKVEREAERDTTYTFPLSGRVHQRPKGDILQPERCPAAVLIDLKANSRNWANQEQQRPVPLTGNLLNPNWLRLYRASTPLPTFFQVVLSVDCNFAAGRDNDLVAIHKYALVMNRRYLIDWYAEVIGFGATKAQIKIMARGGHRVSWLSIAMPAATQVLIENKANGPAIAEQLRADPEFNLAVIEYNPKGSKTQRFIAATADAEAGLCWFPEDAPWIGTPHKQLCSFAGEGSLPHDDDCDAWSQFVNWSRQHQYGLLAAAEKESAVLRQSDQPVRRCEYQTEDGRTVILEFDETRWLWINPQDPSETYEPAAQESVSDSQAAIGTSTAVPGQGKANGTNGAAGGSEAAHLAAGGEGARVTG